MADWGGFSEAELRHLRSGGDTAPPIVKSTATKSGSSKTATKKAGLGAVKVVLESSSNKLIKFE